MVMGHTALPGFCVSVLWKAPVAGHSLLASADLKASMEGFTKTPSAFFICTDARPYSATYPKPTYPRQPAVSRTPLATPSLPLKARNPSGHWMLVLAPWEAFHFGLTLPR